ncbi:unnamed protein product [Closterium sp. Naga37s-1]|nr:unnamed protein product [Closterium sp. Naga37s-1]
MALMNPMALMTSCAHQPHAPITVHASLFNPPLSLPLSSPPCSAPRAPRGQSSHRPVELIDAVLCRPSPCMHDRACITRVEQASPMELINAVPPVLVHSRVVACRGGPNPRPGPFSGVHQRGCTPTPFPPCPSLFPPPPFSLHHPFPATTLFPPPPPSLSPPGPIPSLGHPVEYPRGRDAPQPSPCSSTCPHLPFSPSLLPPLLLTGPNPALGHPVEYINVDAPQPAVCKYCGLRYLQDHSH